MISNLKNFTNQNITSKLFYIINHIIALLNFIKDLLILLFLIMLIENLSIKEKNNKLKIFFIINI